MAHTHPARVVLTGGIGSGKSTARNAFEGLGVWTVDADDLAHELTGPEGAAMPAIVARWGAGMAHANGSLNRVAMRNLVFQEPLARQALESMLHPMVAQLAEARLASPPQGYALPYVMYVVPLWFETRGLVRPPEIFSVGALDLPEALQWDRVMLREATNGMSAETLRGILRRQVSAEVRRGAADWLLDNRGSLQDLHRAVALRHELLCESLQAAH